MKIRLQEYLSLLLMMLLTCGMVAFRLRVTHTPYYGFLFWNLFLALLPLAITTFYRLTSHKFKSRWYFLFCAAFWLLFFPNAPYITTDLMHLGNLHQMPDWFDPLMVLSAALTGLWAGFMSLRDIEHELLTWLNAWVARVFVALIWFLSGIGIYLGRVLRWNSWDIFRVPFSRLLNDILAPFLKPAEFPRSLGMIFCISAFLWINYLFWRQNHYGGNLPGKVGPQARSEK